MMSVPTQSTIAARVATTVAYAGLILGLVGASHAMGQASSLDSDGDGMVSYGEMLVAMPDMTEAEFQALDTDGDGLLDADEVSAAQDAGLVPAG
jgi:hypothetical protein